MIFIIYILITLNNKAPALWAISVVLCAMITRNNILWLSNTKNLFVIAVNVNLVNAITFAGKACDNVDNSMM